LRSIAIRYTQPDAGSVVILTFIITATFSIIIVIIIVIIIIVSDVVAALLICDTLTSNPAGDKWTSHARSSRALAIRPAW